MIVLRQLTKVYTLNGQRRVVADRIDAAFPSGVAVALLGRNGAGKSTLLRLIAGTSLPTSGEVLTTGRVSFPVGLASALHPDMTGAQNTRFVARIYGADTAALLDWVQDFAELGAQFHQPVRSYSSGMRARLSFGINMGLPFDTYLVDEVTAVGDAAFRRKSGTVFRARMEKAGAIWASHSMGQLREICTAGALLEEGRLLWFDEVEEAIDRYRFGLDPGRSHAARAVPGPEGVRLCFGLGLEGTHAGWVEDCLARHRACLYGPARALHHFDIRAGLSRAVLRRRTRALRELAGRLAAGPADPAALERMAEAAALLRMHSGPGDAAWMQALSARRTTQAVLCDATPAYACLGAADLARMAEQGEAVFALVLRDPAALVWERAMQALPPGRRTGAAGLSALDRIERLGPDHLAKRWPDADYPRLLAALDAAVPRARQIVLSHERLEDAAARPAELARLWAALAIPPLPGARLPPFPAPPEVPPLPGAAAARLRLMLAPHYAARRARSGPEAA